MARKRTRYTDEERASLVVMLESEGYPGKLGALTKVSEYSKVPKRTLRRWFKGENGKPPDKVVRLKKEDLADKFEGIAYAMLDHAGGNDIIEEMQGKDAVMSAAIATDKMRLLRGLPTEIVEIIPTIQDIYKALQEKGLEPGAVFGRMKQRLLYDDSDTLQ